MYYKYCQECQWNIIDKEDICVECGLSEEYLWRRISRIEDEEMLASAPNEILENNLKRTKKYMEWP